MPDTTGDAPELVTVDAGTIYDELITGAEAAVRESLYPGDERRIFLEAMMPVLVGIYNSVNDAAKQSMLRYARGTVLDALGERLGVTRLAGIPASCTLRFELAEPRTVATAIPRWTKATADSTVYFATDEDAVIPSGETSVDVPASCTGAGEVGNGYPAGTVSTLVDLIAYVSKVSNLEETFGGDDGEEYDDEGDDRYRERIRLAPEALSVAGPEDAYIYWAKTADASIADVAAISETEEYEVEAPVHDNHAFVGGDQLRPDLCLEVEGAEEISYTYEDGLLDIDCGELEGPTAKVRLAHDMAGMVRIVPLMEDGEAPGEDVLARIEATVNAKDVRPMTDVVRVSPPTMREYGISLTYWATPDSEAAVVEAIEGEDGAIARFIALQGSRLGRDINPDVLKTLVMDAGAIRAEVDEPSYEAVGAGEVARFNGSRTVSHRIESQARWEE